MTCIVAAGVMGLVLLVAVSLALYANYRFMKNIAERQGPGPGDPQ